MKPSLSMQELGYRSKLRPRRNVIRPEKKSSSKESFTPSFEDKENVSDNLDQTKVALSNLPPPKAVPPKFDKNTRDLLDQVCRPPRPNLNESLEKLSVDDSDMMSPVNNRFCSSPMVKPKVINKPEQKSDEEDSDVEILARNNKPVIPVDDMEMSMNQSYTCLPQSAKKLVTDHGLPKISPFRRISLLHENGDPATSETPKKRQKTALKQTRNLATELSKVSETQEREINSTESLVDVSKFENELEDVSKKIDEKIEYWAGILKTDTEIPEHNKGDINANIGKFNLLLNSKFKQYRSLVNMCHCKILDPAEKKYILTGDLEGYWFIVQMQLDQIFGSFHELEKLKQNNWQEIKIEETLPKPTKKSVKKSKPKPTKPRGPSKFAMFRKQQLAKLKQENNIPENTIPEN